MEISSTDQYWHINEEDEEFLLGADHLLDIFAGDTDIVNIHAILGDAVTGTQTWSLPNQYINVESPASSLKPNNIGNNETQGNRGGTSGSEQSDDESMEIEADPSEQCTPMLLDSKRIRRMELNRESARRSREKKQAHLVNLELLVDQLREEKASLSKRLTDANQQFSEAATNNHVLRSNVEALRAEVKMVEAEVQMVDLVVQTSSTCGLLLQNYINIIRSIPMMNTQNLPFQQGPSQVEPTTGDEAEAFNIGLQTDMHTSCTTAAWAWE